MTLTIRSLSPEEWRTWRDTRLAALTDAPEAFGGSYAQSAAYPEEQWRQWCGQPSWFAFDGEDTVGMVRVLVRDGAATPELISLWVAPRARGSQAATLLVAEVVAWARREGHAEVTLFVMADNARALALYRRLGFAETGERVELDDGRAELGMALPLQTAG